MNIEVDTDTPVGTALAITDKNKLLFQHGGVATRIDFDSVTVEPVEALLARGLKADADKVTVARMDSRGQACIITPDKAITYEGCVFTDLPLDDVAANIKTTEDREFVPDIPYPLIAYVDKPRSDIRHITVALTGYSFEFIDPTLKVTEPVRLYMPPLWFGISLAGVNITEMRVAVVPEYNGKATSTPLFGLPLPNIYSDGHICVGNSRISGVLDDMKSDGSLVTNSITRFFCSSWNADLTYGADDVASSAAMANLKARDSAMYDKFSDIIARQSSSDNRNTTRCVAVMTQPQGWLDLKFRALYGTTKRFLGCTEV